jgi:hypothetical protein
LLEEYRLRVSEEDSGSATENMRGLEIVYCVGSLLFWLSDHMGWAGHVARMLKKGNAHRVLMGKPEKERKLGEFGCRLENDIK